MDKIVDFFIGFNIQTILSMTVILWYFTRENKIEMQKEVEAIKQQGVTQSLRSDRLYEMFIELLKDRKI